jgi:coenzyme PQQ precursor peptide PqqA
MMISFQVAARMGKMAATRPGRTWGAGSATLRRSSAMKWETPTAIDLRFGMEITMYIANR